MMVVEIESDSALYRIDCPTGRDDWLVVDNLGLAAPLPMEWTAYDMREW